MIRKEYKKMSRAHNPYGDGSASKNIVNFFFKIKKNEKNRSLYKFKLFE